MDNIIKMFWIIGALAIVMLLVVSLLAAIGTLNLKNNCFYRYNFDSHGNQVNVNTTSVTIKANGNYDNPPPKDKNPAYFGKWRATGVSPESGQSIRVKVTGHISLCRAYIPINNPQLKNNKDNKGELIPIPRVEENNFFPVSLYFDAKIDEWRNLATISTGDRVVISVSAESKDRKNQAGAVILANNTQFKDIFTKSTITHNCSDGQRDYHPICGKYSIYKGQYISGCSLSQTTNPLYMKHDRECHTKYYLLDQVQSEPVSFCSNYPNKEINQTLYEEYESDDKLNYVTNNRLCKEEHCFDPSLFLMNADNNQVYMDSANCNDLGIDYVIIHNTLLDPPGPGDVMARQIKDDYICKEDGIFYVIPGSPMVGQLLSVVEKVSDDYAKGKITDWEKVRVWIVMLDSTVSSLISDIHRQSCKSKGRSIGPDEALRVMRNNYYFRYICHQTKPGNIWQNVYSVMPEPYHSDGRYTYGWSNNLADLIKTFDTQCGTTALHQVSKKFWYSANDATGLLYRFSDEPVPSNIKYRGTDYQFASIQEDQTLYNDPDYKIIYNEEYKDGPSPTYMQFRFIQEDEKFANNTGGYILNIKQTSCRGVNGRYLPETVGDQGQIEYIFVPSGEDPNNSSKTYTSSFITVDDKGEGDIRISSTDVDKQIWMRIKNHAADYTDSVGEYDIDIRAATPTNAFNTVIMKPLLTLFKEKGRYMSRIVFKNMVCFQPSGSTNSCINFFNYIRGMLTLTIIVYSAMFMLGMSQVDQKSLAINLIKFLFVAGLINGTTFKFFDEYLIDLITTFSDVIMSNISGYNIFTGHGEVTNPFTFLDALMTNMLFNRVFIMQVSALMSLGMSGILYFIIVVIAVFLMVISALRAVAVYIMAFLAICVLLGVAPIFLSFMLFSQTRYLFDNWIKMTVKYMFEPLILMIGIIILAQLFTIYLDFVLGYSVCWKCALSFKMPLSGITGINVAILNMPIFCFNWFAPWGFDHSAGMMGVDMANIAALVIIAYCMYGYIELSSKIVGKLIGGGGPSATSMGGKMSSSAQESMLKPIGLDSKSRKEMSKARDSRIKEMSEATGGGKGILGAISAIRGGSGASGGGAGGTGGAAGGAGVGRSRAGVFGSGSGMVGSDAPPSYQEAMRNSSQSGVRGAMPPSYPGAGPSGTSGAGEAPPPSYDNFMRSQTSSGSASSGQSVARGDTTSDRPNQGSAPVSGQVASSPSTQEPPPPYSEVGNTGSESGQPSSSSDNARASTARGDTTSDRPNQGSAPVSGQESSASNQEPPPPYSEVGNTGSESGQPSSSSDNARASTARGDTTSDRPNQGSAPVSGQESSVSNQEPPPPYSEVGNTGSESSQPSSSSDNARASTARGDTTSDRPNQGSTPVSGQESSVSNQEAPPSYDESVNSRTEDLQQRSDTRNVDTSDSASQRSSTSQDSPQGSSLQSETATQQDDSSRSVETASSSKQKLDLTTEQNTSSSNADNTENNTSRRNDSIKPPPTKPGSAD